jgi:Arc/MetJ-type ribon-helix-helix transcriptional regulator
MEPNTSVSDIVRRALRQYLERDEAFEHLDQWARNAIRLEMQTKLARPELTHSGGD